MANASADSALGALYRSIWKMPRLPSAEQVATLANWGRTGGPALNWAAEATGRHPDLWGIPIRDFFLERLRVGWDLNQEWAARQLSAHADSTTRGVFAVMAGGDSTQRRLAVLLGSRDSTAWVRRTILMIADDALAGIPGQLPYLNRLDTPDFERWLPTLQLLGALTEALSPANSEPERLALIHIAQRARPRHWLRYAALRPLAHDSSEVVRELIWETVRGDSASRTFWIEDAPEPDEVTPYWTADELHRALQDPSSIVRFYAYDEAARRKDPEVADTLIVWLDQNRVPGRAQIQLDEAVTMIKTLGEIQSPAALPKIMEWGEIDDDKVRVAVMDALGSLCDPRAAPLFRRLARVSCDHMEYFAKRSLAFGLSGVGDTSDVPLFAQWARDCPDVRDVSLEAVGVLGGVDRMVRVIREVERQPMKPEQMRDYELLEARVRERIGQQTNRANAPVR